MFEGGATDMESVRDTLTRLTASLHVLRERYLAEAHRAQEPGTVLSHGAPRPQPTRIHSMLPLASRTKEHGFGAGFVVC